MLEDFTSGEESYEKEIISKFKYGNGSYYIEPCLTYDAGTDDADCRPVY